MELMKEIICKWINKGFLTFLRYLEIFKISSAKITVVMLKTQYIQLIFLKTSLEA